MFPFQTYTQIKAAPDPALRIEGKTEPSIWKGKLVCGKKNTKTGVE